MPVALKPAAPMPTPCSAREASSRLPYRRSQTEAWNRGEGVESAHAQERERERERAVSVGKRVCVGGG